MSELNLTIKQWLHIREFVITIRVCARADVYFGKTSPKAMTRLRLDLEGSLINKDNRIKFLQAVTGININSQKQLTAHYTSTLIEETYEGKNRETIQDIERFIESRTAFNPWSLFPWEKPTGDMPDM